MKTKNHLPVKKNNASIQVLKTLRMLMQGPYTMAELIENLNAGEKEPVFNNNVVSKYINTCRYCGINIPRINNKYFVASIPFGMELVDRELELLKDLQTTARDKMSTKANKEFNKFLEILSAYSNKEIVKLDSEKSNEIGEIFNKAIESERKILLLLKNKARVKCVPQKIVKKNDKLFFDVLIDNEGQKLINTSRVSALEILNEKLDATIYNEKVVFKIKGDLIKKYKLRVNEESISESFANNYITVSNIGENPETLLSRLMRYDTLCEVVKPNRSREAMKKMINDTLANYDVK